MSDPAGAEENAYKTVLARIFLAKYAVGLTTVDFSRAELESAVKDLGLVVANLGDILYAARSRNGMPAAIVLAQPPGMEWVIEGAGKSKYRFRLTRFAQILPRSDLAVIEIPDATPEIIREYRLDDEQALLAVIRYNRLIDIFLGLTTYSLQNHLRTSVAAIGQIEIDELYVGIDTGGRRCMIPVQAKGGRDRITTVQTRQDLAWCDERWKGTPARAVAAQFMADERVALLELALQDDEVRVVEERHYKLVPAPKV